MYFYVQTDAAHCEGPLTTNQQSTTSICSYSLLSRNARTNQPLTVKNKIITTLVNNIIIDSRAGNMFCNLTINFIQLSFYNLNLFNSKTSVFHIYIDFHGKTSILKKKLIQSVFRQ